MAILNYTTKISPDKTVGEIQSLLGKKGAKSVNLEYAERRPAAVLFVVSFNGQDITFRLPCNIKGVLEAMRKDRKIPRSSQNYDQAERTAWRIVKDWIEAQMAIIESGQSEMAEVFMPYAVVAATDKTLFQTFTESPNRLLLSGK